MKTRAILATAILLNAVCHSLHGFNVEIDVLHAWQSKPCFLDAAKRAPRKFSGSMDEQATAEDGDSGELGQDRFAKSQLRVDAPQIQ
jgi:hypothetical protein